MRARHTDDNGDLTPAGLTAAFEADDKERADDIAYVARISRLDANSRAEATDIALLVAVCEFDMDEDDPHTHRVARRAAHRWTKAGWRT